MMTITTAPDEWTIRLGLVVLTHEGGEKGRRYPGGVITLRSDLGPIARRCTLMHEIGHVIHDDEPGTPAWRDARQEKRADEWAVTQLVSCEDYATAENLVGSSEGALARELGITTHLLRVWRGLHERRTAA